MNDEFIHCINPGSICVCACPITNDKLSCLLCWICSVCMCVCAMLDRFLTYWSGYLWNLIYDISAYIWIMCLFFFWCSIQSSFDLFSVWYCCYASMLCISLLFWLPNYRLYNNKCLNTDRERDTKKKEKKIERWTTWQERNRKTLCVCEKEKKRGSVTNMTWL